MKKVLIIAAIALSAFKVSAQTEQGKVSFGGSFDYTTSKTNASGAKSSEDLTVLPMIGYFVANNISIGTGIGYTYSKIVSGAKNNSFVVAPFGRYYKSLGSEQFKFIAELAVPLAFGKAKDANGDELGTSTTAGVSLAPGFSFFPTKKFGIELGLKGISYISTTVEDKNGKKVDTAGSKTFSVGADFFSPQLGFQFYF